jgi:hypothetical protein
VEAAGRGERLPVALFKSVSLLAGLP